MNDELILDEEITNVDIFVEGVKVPKKKDLINQLTTEIKGEIVYCNDLAMQRLLMAKTVMMSQGQSETTWLTVSKLPITLTVEDIDTIMAHGVQKAASIMLG